jgi:tRNA threonylcarbamoyladenosine biosynthesis protein TsaE
VLLDGPLGAGKTLFTRGLVSGLLGAKAASQVKSPSFVLINEYRGSKGPLVAHIDFYRLTGWKELLDEALDYLSAPCLIVIEWPKLCQSFFVPHVRQAYNISIEIAGPSERLVTVEEL